MDWLEEAQLDNLQYWAGRSAKTQQHLTDEGIKAAEKQMLTYYQRTQKGVIEQFVATYEHLLARAEDGKVTPADLYKLDKYWQMQAQVAAELEKLGDRQAAYLNRAFTQHYQEVYDALAVPSEAAFATIDKATANQMINQIWCADGKAWSARIWHNRDLLREELNERLIECVVGGKKPTQLKHALMERFEVSYYRANTLVHTEMAHIQTQAAQQRYKDMGITEMEFWAAPDERTCDVCGKLHKKRYPIGSIAPIPAHPNCRCCLIPVV